jgi:hypothetical protein
MDEANQGDGPRREPGAAPNIPVHRQRTEAAIRIRDRKQVQRSFMTLQLKIAAVPEF